MQTKTIKIIYWISTILFAGFMLFSASAELMQTESAQKALTDLGYPIYLNYIIGTAKLLGAIAILQLKFKTIKEWAYAGFVIDIMGASASIAFMGGGLTSLVVLPFLLVLFVSYASWKRLY